jgi:hypothetical protein
MKHLQRKKGFFAVFDGIDKARFAICHKHRFCNPEGIESRSPGLARFREGLPREHVNKNHYPERVEYQRLTKWMQLFQSCGFLPVLTQGSFLPPPSLRFRRRPASGGTLARQVGAASRDPGRRDSIPVG